MRILLSDGSGLTSRQTAARLAAAGHVVGVLSPEPLALTRFTRTVRHSHRVPVYGTDPLGWLDAALAICRVVGCRVGWKRLPTVPFWSFMRGISWFACWFPWPIVWRGRRWWSPHQAVKPQPEVLETQRQPGGPVD